MPPLTAGGTAGYVLSGTSGSSHGQGTTVVGSLSNGIVTLTGTFVLYPRSASGSASLPDQIAGNNSEIVTFVPGTLTAQSTQETGTDLASTAVTTAFNEDGEPFDIMQLVFQNFDDQTRPWQAINTFGDPGFEQAVVCLGELCTRVPRDASRRFTPEMVVR